MAVKAQKLIAQNKKASHNYHLLERFEAGIVLKGSEVKSLRDGKVNLKDGYCTILDGEVWLKNIHINEYKMANILNHDPLRSRKLLLKTSEIHKLINKTQEKGLTAVPTKIYFKNGRAKVEIALAKAKKMFDKRESLHKRQADREIQRQMRRKK